MLLLYFLYELKRTAIRNKQQQEGGILFSICFLHWLLEIYRMKGKSMVVLFICFGARLSGFQCWVPLLTGWVTLGKLLSLLLSQFPQLWSGIITVFLRTFTHHQWVTTCKEQCLAHSIPYMLAINISNKYSS